MLNTVTALSLGRKKKGVLKLKKFISAAMCFVLAFSMLGVCAFAAANGDINNDKSITASDARGILRASVGLDKLSADQKNAADIDMDGEVTASDARLALRIAVDLEKTNGELYNNEFEVFQSGFFFIDMDVIEGGEKQNVKMALTDKSTYLSVAFESDGLLGSEFGFEDLGNMNIAFLFNENDMYFIDEGSKTYAPMSAMFKLMGEELTEEDLAGSLGDMDIGLGVALSDADKVSTEKFNGVTSQKYSFVLDDGSTTNVFMNGKKFVGMTNEGPNGKEEVRYVINSLTLTVPSGYTVPSSAYTEVDPLEMLAGMLLGEDFDSLFG